MTDTSRLPFHHRKKLWLALAVLTAVAIILRTVSFCVYMEEIGYFREGAVTLALFYAVIAIATLLCLSFFFLINIKDVASEPFVLPTAQKASAIATAIPFGLSAIAILLNVSTLTAPLFFILFSIISLLCGAAYFILRATRTARESTVLFGYGAILATAFSLILTYFDRYTQMNAPHKLSFHVCMLLAMIALLLEQRDLLCRPLPRLRLVPTPLAATFCLSLAFPNILAFLGGVYDDLLYLCFDLATLGLGTYFTTKCIRYALTPAQEVSE